MNRRAFDARCFSYVAHDEEHTSSGASMLCAGGILRTGMLDFFMKTCVEWHGGHMFKRGWMHVFGFACISGAAWGANSHCQKQEIEVFGCAVAQKTLSVCASANYTSKEGHLQYRFGIAGKPELILPRDRWRGGATEARAETFGNGGQTGYLRFWNGQVAYVVFHGNLRDGSGWKETAGVAVETKGKRSALLLCSGTLSSKLLDVRYMRDTLGFMDNSEAPGFDFP